jgi:hypothetical protein
MSTGDNAAIAKACRFYSATRWSDAGMRYFSTAVLVLCPSSIAKKQQQQHLTCFKHQAPG